MSDHGQPAAVLRRAFELASGELEGIDSAAKELAGMCGHDASLLNEARKEIARQISEEGSSSLRRQVASLLRRAFELGEWRQGFADTPEVP